MLLAVALLAGALLAEKMSYQDGRGFIIYGPLTGDHPPRSSSQETARETKDSFPIKAVPDIGFTS